MYSFVKEARLIDAQLWLNGILKRYTEHMGTLSFTFTYQTEYSCYLVIPLHHTLHTGTPQARGMMNCTADSSR